MTGDWWVGMSSESITISQECLGSCQVWDMGKLQCEVLQFFSSRPKQNSLFHTAKNFINRATTTKTSNNMTRLPSGLHSNCSRLSKRMEPLLQSSKRLLDYNTFSHHWGLTLELIHYCFLFWKLKDIIKGFKTRGQQAWSLFCKFDDHTFGPHSFKLFKTWDSWGV